MTTLTQLLNTYREAAQTEREKGSYFEELICTYLRNEPTYQDLYEKVWLYSDWARENDLDARDTGIDLVAKTQGTDEYHAIQCKLYAENYRLRKEDIDSFFTASGKKIFSHRIIVSTTNNWNDHAEAAIQDQNPPVTKIDLNDLENSKINWAKYQPKKEIIFKPQKTLREHQVNALDGVEAGLKLADRGKLIMACGTGKTFTGLKIAEKLATLSEMEKDLDDMNTSISTVKSNLRNSGTCENCNLDDICLPKGFDQFEIGELSLLVSRNNIRQKGEVIYHAGSPYRGMIAIRSGSAKLISFGLQGQELIVDFTLPGEVLGFDGLETKIYNCTAIALETVNYCYLEDKKIDHFDAQNSHINELLLQRSCAQFNAQVNRMILNRSTAEERVAYFLLQISERLKKRGYSELEFRLSMTREEIGNHLGLAHETVSRLFNSFQVKNMIEVQLRLVKIIDKKKLLNVINQETV